MINWLIEYSKPGFPTWMLFRGLNIVIGNVRVMSDKYPVGSHGDFVRKS